VKATRMSEMKWTRCHRERITTAARRERELGTTRKKGETRHVHMAARNASTEPQQCWSTRPRAIEDRTEATSDVATESTRSEEEKEVRNGGEEEEKKKQRKKKKEAEEEEVARQRTGKEKGKPTEENTCAGPIRAKTNRGREKRENEAREICQVRERERERARARRACEKNEGGGGGKRPREGVAARTRTSLARTQPRRVGSHPATFQQYDP